MMKNKKIATILAISLVILMVQQAAALGITPGKKNIDFEPGKTHEVDLSLISSAKEAKTIKLSSKGELKNNIELSKDQIKIPKNKDRKSLTYKLNLPEEFEEPGQHKAKIEATESKGNIKKGETKVGSKISVISKLNVEVPYPGKYLEIIETKVESGTNESEFFIQLENKGKKAVKQAKITVKVKNPEGEQIAKTEETVKKMNPGKRAETTPEIQGLETGRYTAEVRINYAGQSKTSEKEFSVGQESLSIKEMYVEDFELGEIAKFNTLVKNNYNTKIKGLQMNMTVLNQNSEPMENIRSNSYTIAPESTKNVESFWDTEGIEKGVYEGRIELHHSLGSFSKGVTFDVRSDKILVQGVGGEVVAEEVEDNNLLRTILFAAAGLAVINLIYFGIKRLIKKKKAKKVKGLFSKEK